uniref:non-specific serine/threonine protein kinase n=1 Tax=Magallana gigas TaxID=29159 RepID=K1RCF7_MAGGI
MVSEENHFERGKLLGEGAFGKVFLCHDKEEQDKKYAMKVIDLKELLWEERDLAEKEANLLTTLQHQYILHAVTTFQEKETLCIVTEFCDHGDLEQYLKSRKGKSLEEQRIVEWFRQICSALEYLHGRNVLHRDIKTQNIFLTGTEMTAKLGDLGLAKVLESSFQKALTFCGSPYYMSPEILACKAYDSKSDIWAMGVCMYEMATLKRPFNAHRMQQLVFEIVHGQMPPMPNDEYSSQLIEIIERMICRNPDERPSATELLQDVVFKNQRALKKSQGRDALSFNNPMDFPKEKIHNEMTPDVENLAECGQCLTSADDDADKTLRKVVIEEGGVVYYNYSVLSPELGASRTVTSYSQAEYSEGSTSNSKSSGDGASDTENKEYLKDAKQTLDVDPQADVQQLPKPLKLIKDLRDRALMFLKSKRSDSDNDTRTKIQVLMGDKMRAEIIMALHEPQEIKQQGRCVQNFNQELWYGVRQEIVETGNMAKFSQNEELKNHLFSTFPKILVEASPMDRIWGIGLSKDDKRALKKETWRGQNLLGYILTRLRDKWMESFLEPVVSVKAV